MGAIKITNADKWFAKCVKERAGWKCECCGTQYPEEQAQGLHCSHYFGRAHKALRHEPDNAFAHCYACHQKLGANPHDFAEWVFRAIGDTRYQMLLERRRETVKYSKKVDAEIAAHYREEYKRMRKLREDGEIGEIEFVGFW